MRFVCCSCRNRSLANSTNCSDVNCRLFVKTYAATPKPVDKAAPQKKAVHLLIVVWVVVAGGGGGTVAQFSINQSITKHVDGRCDPRIMPTCWGTTSCAQCKRFFNNRHQQASSSPKATTNNNKQQQRRHDDIRTRVCIPVVAVEIAILIGIHHVSLSRSRGINRTGFLLEVETLNNTMTSW